VTAAEDRDFAVVQHLVEREAGIALEPRQGYLVGSRLAAVVKEEGFVSVPALVDRLRTRPTPELRARVVEAITTNETSFFRDAPFFEALQSTILPDLIRRRQRERTLRIWSAGCSSGQEAYSVAMLLLDEFPQLRDWQVSILGTDVSSAVLEQAASARYTQHEVNRGLPATRLIRHFSRHGTSWVVSPRVQSRVSFRPLNLAKPWAGLPRMDLVLLRNVMLYFAVPTREAVLRQVARDMKPDGWLALGSAESMLGLDTPFRRVPLGKSSGYRLDGKVEEHVGL
jgi:chemotaxis protein methyltransferase CheR